MWKVAILVLDVVVEAELRPHERRACELAIQTPDLFGRPTRHRLVKDALVAGNALHAFERELCEPRCGFDAKRLGEQLLAFLIVGPHAADAARTETASPG